VAPWGSSFKPWRNVACGGVWGGGIPSAKKCVVCLGWCLCVCVVCPTPTRRYPSRVYPPRVSSPPVFLWLPVVQAYHPGPSIPRCCHALGSVSRGICWGVRSRVGQGVLLRVPPGMPNVFCWRVLMSWLCGRGCRLLGRWTLFLCHRLTIRWCGLLGLLWLCIVGLWFGRCVCLLRVHVWPSLGVLGWRCGCCLPTWLPPPVVFGYDSTTFSTQ